MISGPFCENRSYILICSDFYPVGFCFVLLFGGKVGLCIFFYLFGMIGLNLTLTQMVVIFVLRWCISIHTLDVHLARLSLTIKKAKPDMYFRS